MTSCAKSGQKVWPNKDKTSKIISALFPWCDAWQSISVLRCLENLA